MGRNRRIPAIFEQTLHQANKGFIDFCRALQGEARRLRVCTFHEPHSHLQVDQALEALYQKMYNTELHYLSRTEMHSDDKWYVEKYKLYLNLVWLLGEVGGQASDVAGGAGYRPTAASQSVFRDLSQQLETAGTDFNKLMQEVDAFNKAHAGKLPAITDKLPNRQ